MNFSGPSMLSEIVDVVVIRISFIAKLFWSVCPWQGKTMKFYPGTRIIGDAVKNVFTRDFFIFFARSGDISPHRNNFDLAITAH